MTPNQGRVLAAVDLGSNSFHMIVARHESGRLQVLDRLREMVRLASGLDEAHNLSEEKQQAGLDCLARFGERLRHLHADDVRAVGNGIIDEPVMKVQIDRAANTEGWVDLPADDPTNPWTYERDLNAIVFQTQSMPEDGDQIQVLVPTGETL